MVSRVAILLVGLVAIATAQPAASKWKYADYKPRHPTVTPNIRGLPFDKFVEDSFKPQVFIPGYKTVADCGKNKYYGQKIVGGTEAQPNSWPWQVALFFDGGWFCGGSIISEEYVLTAAHCTDGATGVDVIAGAHNIREDEPTQVTYRGVEFKIHEDWQSLRIKNDISLIKLSTPISFTPEIQPVCLPSRADAELGVGETVTPTGWGLTSDSILATISDTLNQVTVPTMSNTECAGTYGSTITENVVCIDSTGGKGTCNGDSGGPLNYDSGSGVYCTRGITSFGSSAGCEAGYPDAFTRVSKYLDWIETNSGIIIQ